MHWRFEKRVRQGDGMEKNAYLKLEIACVALAMCCCASAHAENSMSYFAGDASIKLEEIGSLKVRSSNQIKQSRFSIGFECLDRKYFDPDRVYDKLAKTGVKYARCQTGWNRCETKKGVYDFAWLDSVVDNLRARGIEPWFNVGFGNKLYMPDAPEAAVGYCPINYGAEALEAWKNYVGALAKHFKGRVAGYELWNEPNIRNFWAPKKPDPKEYAKFVNITAQEILKEDANAKIGACVAGSMIEFTVDFFKAGGGKHLNFFSIHPYRTMSEIGHDAETKAMRAAFKKYEPGKDIELWNGESGFGSYFPPKHFLKTWHRGSEQNQSKWLLRRFVLDRAADYAVSSFFQCVDLPDTYSTAIGRQLPCKHGIIRAGDYTEKHAYYALSRICSVFDEHAATADIYAVGDLFDGFPQWQRVSRVTDASIIIKTFTRNSYPLFAYWIPEDPQFDYDGLNGFRLSFLDFDRLTKNPVLIDMMTGRVFRCSSFSISKEGGTVRVSKLPISNYPLLLTDFDAVKDIVALNIPEKKLSPKGVK